MKLKFYIDKKGKKIYTLSDLSPDNKKTKEAHYKFKKAPTFTRTKSSFPVLP